MQLNDAIVGVVLVVFAIAVIIYSTTFPSLHGQAYGPSLFPSLIGVCLAACGLILVVRGLKAHRRSTQTAATVTPGIENQSGSPSWIRWGDWVSERSRLINMLLVPGLLIIYILLSDWIGFIPLSILILAVLLYRLGTSLLLSLSIACVSTVLLQLLFAKVLLVPLPQGLLLPWIG